MDLFEKIDKMIAELQHIRAFTATEDELEEDFKQNLEEAYDLIVD